MRQPFLRQLQVVRMDQVLRAQRKQPQVYRSASASIEGQSGECYPYVYEWNCARNLGAGISTAEAERIADKR